MVQRSSMALSHAESSSCEQLPRPVGGDKKRARRFTIARRHTLQKDVVSPHASKGKNMEMRLAVQGYCDATCQKRGD